MTRYQFTVECDGSNREAALSNLENYLDESNEWMSGYAPIYVSAPSGSLPGGES